MSDRFARVGIALALDGKRESNLEGKGGEEIYPMNFPLELAR